MNLFHASSKEEVDRGAIVAAAASSAVRDAAPAAAGRPRPRAVALVAVGARAVREVEAAHVTILVVHSFLVRATLVVPGSGLVLRAHSMPIRAFPDQK